MAKIEYNYPIEELDRLVSMIYDEGITPMMTPDLASEVELRYQELQHGEYDEDDEDNEEYRTAKEKHDEAMKRMEENKRKSHSRNIMILDLTEEEKAEIEDDISMSYIRNDPNSAYNMSAEDISSDETKRRIYKQLQSLGKVYYHQKDYQNAMKIIMEAIEYSLRNDYPWMSYAEACEQFKAGKIRYTFAQLPLLFIDYNTQITDPALLSGIVNGDITLVDKDKEPVKKKKVKSKPVDMDYSVIGPAEHMRMVQLHQAGYNTDISTILKSCSTIYNRYVIPTSYTWNQQQNQSSAPTVDWTQPGAGETYFNAKYGKKSNTIGEVVALLNEDNDRKLNHVIGTSMRDFLVNWNRSTDEPMSFKALSTSLQQNDQAVAIESKILDLMRQSNANMNK